MSIRMLSFRNVFRPKEKKIPPSKSATRSRLYTLDRSTREVELGLEYGPPAMKLGGQTLKFEDGQWIIESGIREVQDLEKRNSELEEENNLLKLKIETLLNMLTETTVEYQLMVKEVEDLKSRRQGKKV